LNQDNSVALDAGRRRRYRGTAQSIEAALEAVSRVIEARPEGWRVRLATLRSQVDRGLRVSWQVELVSPEWVFARREVRSRDQSS